MTTVNVTLNETALPIELVAMISTVIGGNTIDAVSGNHRIANLHERGENIRTMQGNKAFADYLKAQGESMIAIHIYDMDEDDNAREKRMSVKSSDFIAFLKNWSVLLAMKETIKGMATVERFGVWGERGRKSNRVSADDMLSAGLAGLGIELAQAE